MDPGTQNTKASSIWPASARDWSVETPTVAKLAAEVESDYQEGVARGIAHTPTALVNGQPFIETFTYEEISKAIDSELATAK